MKRSAVQIVMAHGSMGASPDDDALDAMLRRIAVAASRDPGREWADKYGADHDGPVFMMHPFCWCERDDCRWCSEDACGCPHAAPIQYLDGKIVTHDEWWKWSQALLGPSPMDKFKFGTPEFRAYDREWKKRVRERNRRSPTVYLARVHTCEPRGMMADRPEGADWRPNQSAPNFWFKPTGFRVWWYKYIGRSVEIAGSLPAGGLAEVERLCMAEMGH